MQLSFDFQNNKNQYDIKNFIIHTGNRDVFDFITSSFLITNNIFLISGDKYSGKTYICNIWHNLTGALFINEEIFNYNYNKYISYIDKEIQFNSKYIIDNIDIKNINEEYLLYLFNTIIERKSILVITSNRKSFDFSFKIEDLQSRFKNIVNLDLKNIQEDEKEKIILKLLLDRQLNIEYNILNFISKNLSNNYTDIIDFINNLESLLNKNKIKKITLKSIKELLSIVLPILIITIIL